MDKDKLKWYLKEGIKSRSYQQRFHIACDFPQDEIEIMIDEIIDEHFSGAKAKISHENSNCTIPHVINSAVPEWLTEETRARVRQTWNEHKDHNDSKRIEAMRIVQKSAEAAGYRIDIKKATELLQQHCL